MYFEHANLNLSDKQLDMIASRKGITRQAAIEMIQNDPDPRATAAKRRQESSQRFNSSVNTQQNTNSVLKNLPKDIVDSIVGIGDATLGLPVGLANLISPKSMQLKAPRNSQGEAYEAGRVGGDVASFIGAGVPAKTVLKGSELLPVVGKAAKYLEKERFLPNLLRRASGAAAYEGLKQPEEGENRSEKALLGGGTAAILESLFHIPKGYRSSKDYFSKHTPSKKLLENLEASRGTKTPLGEVLQSPVLKRFYENRLPSIPFSGVANTQAEIGKGLENEANNIFKKYSHGNAPEDLEEILGRNLVRSFREKNKIKNEKYNIADIKASEEGYFPDLPNFIEEVKKQKRLSDTEIPFQETRKGVQALFKYLTEKGKRGNGEKEKVRIAGQEITLPDNLHESLLRYGEETNPNPLTYAEAKSLSKYLHELENEHSGYPTIGKRIAKGTYGNLARVLRTELKNDVENRGSSGFKKAAKEADEYYKKNTLDYLDKEVFPRVSGATEYIEGHKTKVDPQKIVSELIKTGPTNDIAYPIEKIKKVLSPEDWDLFRAAYLKRAINESGEVGPKALKTVLSKSKIGTKQKKALFTPEELETLEPFSKRVALNTEALDIMFNPKTGQRGVEALNHMIGALFAGGIGGGLGLTAGEGEKGVLAGLGLGILGGKSANKLLTSEKFREKLIRSILKNRKAQESSSVLSKNLENVVKKYLVTEAASKEKTEKEY